MRWRSDQFGRTKIIAQHSPRSRLAGGAPEDIEEGELKDNRPTQEVEVTDYFPSAPAGEGGQQDLCREGHGRIEARTYTASSKVDWTVSDRSNPGEPPLHPHPDDRRLYIPSAPLDIDRLSLMR